MATDDTRDLVQGLMEGRVSRRQFLARALALGMSASTIGAILAACGAKTPGAATKAPSTGKPTTGATKAPVTTKPTSAATSAPSPTSAPVGTTTAAPVATVAPGATTTSGPSAGMTASPSAALSQLAPIGSLPAKTTSPTGGEFHAAYPYTPPPQGSFNSWLSYGLQPALGIYYDLQEMPLAKYLWKEGKYVPMLATSWEVVPPDTFRVTLRSNVKWSDGKPFTAKDVVTTFTIARLLAYSVWNYLGSVTAEGDNTVVFKMASPSTVVPRYVLETQIRQDAVYGSWAQKAQALFAKGINPMTPAGAKNKEYTKLNTDFQKNKIKAPTPVTGPFIIDKNSITSSQLTLVKNKSSWIANQVNFDKIVVYNGETPTVTPLVLARQVDFATHGFAVATAKQFEKQGIRVAIPPTHFGPAVFFNFKKFPEFNDARVRQAIAYAINKETNATISLGKSAKVSKYMTGVPDEIIEHWLSTSDLSQMEPYKYDPGKAEKLLTQAGWKKVGGKWQTPQGKPAKYEFATVAEYADWNPAGTNAADQLNSFGFQTTPKTITYTQYGDFIQKGQFDLAIESWGTGAPHPYFSYVTDLFSNNDNGDAKSGMQFKMTQNVPGLGTLDLKKMVTDLPDGLDIHKQTAGILKLAKAYNYLLPQVPLWERYGDCPVLEGVRVTGWPPDSDPLWQNNLYSDCPTILWILNGQLKGVKK